MDITGLVIGLVIGNITGFVFGTIYVVGAVKKNLAKFGKDTMENFFKDAVAMSDPQPVVEPDQRQKRLPVTDSRPSDYTQRHKRREP